MSTDVKAALLWQEIDEFVSLCEMMDDDDFSNALNTALKVIANPFVPKEKAAAQILLFTAYGVKFQNLAKTYQTLVPDSSRSTQVNHKKKTMYYTMAEQCHLMANAFKFLVREL